LNGSESVISNNVVPPLPPLPPSSTIQNLVPGTFIPYTLTNTNLTSSPQLLSRISPDVSLSASLPPSIPSYSSSSPSGFQTSTTNFSMHGYNNIIVPSVFDPNLHHQANNLIPTNIANSNGIALSAGMCLPPNLNDDISQIHNVQTPASSFLDMPSLSLVDDFGQEDNRSERYTGGAIELSAGAKPFVPKSFTPIQPSAVNISNDILNSNQSLLSHALDSNFLSMDDGMGLMVNKSPAANLWSGSTPLTSMVGMGRLSSSLHPQMTGVPDYLSSILGHGGNMNEQLDAFDSDEVADLMPHLDKLADDLTET
jgi:hypothetical protein